MFQLFGDIWKICDFNKKLLPDFFAINRFLKSHVNGWFGGTIKETLKFSVLSKFNVLSYEHTITKI